METINLNNLMVMQDDFRNIKQIPAMIDFVKNGGFWTVDSLKNYALSNNIRISPLMEIIKFPDNKLMIHDGNHRAVSICLGNRDYIREDEYVYKYWTYEEYLEINFENRWVTPFDPRYEIRIPDIYDFKKKALELSQTDPDVAIRFINENKHIYVRPRTINNLNDLADKYLSLQNNQVIV